MMTFQQFPAIVELTKWDMKECFTTSIEGPYGNDDEHMYYIVTIEETNPFNYSNKIPKTVKRHFFKSLHKELYESCTKALNENKSLGILLQPRLYREYGNPTKSEHYQSSDLSINKEMFTYALINEPDLALFMLESIMSTKSLIQQYNKN